MNQPLIFHPHIAQDKPTNKDICPFCHPDTLEKILDQEGSLMWLDNKYPVLDESYQTIIIESSQHLGDIANYESKHNRRLFRFALQAWQQLAADQSFTSVVLFKNFGPLSGGSLRHPHMQIVGFKKADAYADISQENFTGLLIQELTDSQAKITLSDKPLMGFCEFNIAIRETASSDLLADAVQKMVRYVLNEYFSGRCQSYNLFFYRLDHHVICKLVPRFVASPYFVGYHLSQVNNFKRLEAIREEVLAYLSQDQ
ncbi:DUF4931 domain-containing protein [Streptococcus macacae]|uniref:Galactose-1-phosphate uridylyltransferase n=1 Tax=Streptococcus macacae NCTC 11558 TaxID=764298 RepID=G5JUK5_9STRE|nr:DUF4931 domain-containing protein [Streptococcus macacae]EHJ52404.1 hypothetical protein STRMA_0833 [Streptococcus macacae NCTC 11558]SUN78646.1 Uncharacterised protein [Streptococcus macacae NCTC 11558]